MTIVLLPCMVTVLATVLCLEISMLPIVWSLSIGVMSTSIHAIMSERSGGEGPKKRKRGIETRRQGGVGE